MVNDFAPNLRLLKNNFPKPTRKNKIYSGSVAVINLYINLYILYIYILYINLYIQYIYIYALSLIFLESHNLFVVVAKKDV